MKILYFTDSHIRGSNPKNRKDDFVYTLENKFKEIIGIIEKEDVDYVIHGGDLFDRPDVAISIVSKFANLLNNFNRPIYIVPGNHDIFGHNPKTLNRTMLGLLDSIAMLNVINEGDKVFLDKDNIRVQLTGQPYIYDLDEKFNIDKYILKNKDDSIDYAIHIVHGLLLEKPFIDGIPYTLVDDIKDTEADVTLAGHYHLGFKTIEYNNKYFINPGSLVRLTNSNLEIKRMPKVIILNLNKDNLDIKEVFLNSAEKGDLILDREKININKYREEQMLEFKQPIESSVDFNKLDINEILIEIASTENIDDKVKNEALNRITLSQIKKAGADNEVH